MTDLKLLHISQWPPAMTYRCHLLRDAGTLGRDWARVVMMATKVSVVGAVDLEVRESKINIALADAIIKPDSRIAFLVRVVRNGYHFHPVQVSLDDIANNRCLCQIPVLDSIFSTSVLFQRSPVLDFSVPPDNLDVSFRCFQASPEHLIPSALVRCQCATQAYFDLLIVLLRLVSAEHLSFAVLVLSPYALEQCGRIGVISLGHCSIGYPVLGDDVVPVNPIFPAADPTPVLRDGIFVELKTGAVRFY